MWKMCCLFLVRSNSIGLNSFLGLEPSELQLQWQDANVQTNQRDPVKMKKALEVEYDQQQLLETAKRLRPQYDETKLILQG